MNKIKFFLFTILLISCQEDSKTSTQDDNVYYRFFDRSVCFSSEDTVSNEKASAIQAAQDALLTMEKNTILGKGFFSDGTGESFCSLPDSELQPIYESTQIPSNKWQSFVQIWEDKFIDDYANKASNNVADPDVFVIVNSNNTNQYFVILRLSCFNGGSSCPSSNAQMGQGLMLRAMGYLMGLNSENSTSKVMINQVDSNTSSEAEWKLLFTEMNNRLESIYNKSPLPNNNMPEEVEPTSEVDNNEETVNVNE